jgi:hypothetical protein
MLISNRTSRLLGIGALLLAAPTLASCTTHPTDEIYTPAAGTNNRDSRVDVLNAVIVANEAHPGEGTLVVTLVNNQVVAVGSTASEDDELVGVGGAVTGKVTSAVTIPSGEFVVLAAKTAAITEAVPGIIVSGDFELGDEVEVEFDFANAKSVTLKVPVVENIAGSQFADQNGPADPAVEPGDAEEHGTSEGH